jgi:HEAT repeats
LFDSYNQKSLHPNPSQKLNKDIMNKFLLLRNKILLLVSLMLTFSFEIWAQAGTVRVPTPQAAAPPPAPPPVEDNTLWYLMMFVLVVGLAAAIFWQRKTKKAAAEGKSAEAKNQLNKNKKDSDSVDADKEMEWYRKNQSVISKKDRFKNTKKTPQTSRVVNKKIEPQSEEEELEEITMEREELREKMMKLQFTQLPITTFNEVRKAKDYSLLPISANEDLLSAVEQAQDEFEEDEEVRDLAVRILAAFKTRNSIESLGQIALYDLSSNLRSKAVSILADYDHESVFETILLACADPTREVRAAAARGLFRLSFDRADAWLRITETDEFRMRQAARAATEADLVKRSFERLIHDDLKIAYEAFAFTTLMIKAGETEQLFGTIETHRDTNVKFALLHVLKVVKSESTLSNLYNLLENDALAPELKEKIDETIKSFDLVAA